MKNKLFTISLLLFLFFIFLFFKSYAPGSVKEDSKYITDTSKADAVDCDTTILYLENEKTLEESGTAISFEGDTIKRGIFKKNIEPIVVDSTDWRRKDSIFRQLEKTEKQLKGQKRYLDSLMIIKRR